MGTIIDSLVIELGFDTKGMEQGRKQVQNAFSKTREGARDTGREIEDSAKKAGQYMERLRNNVLGLFAAFTAGRGLKEFVSDVTSSDAALGRFALTVNQSVLDIASWRGAGRLLGVSASDIDSTFSSLTSQFQQFAITGDSQIVPWFRALGISLSDAQGHMRPVNDLLLELAQRVQGMDTAKATAFLSNMGISPGMINLLLQGPPAIQALIDKQHALAAAQVADAAAAAKRQQAWQSFLSSAETIGTMLLTTLTPALIGLTEAAHAFSSWGERHPTLVGMAFAALTAVVLALSGAILVNLVGSAIASALAGFGALIGLAKGLMLGIAVLAETALPALSEAFLVLGAAIEATPVGWIITAIAAIAAGAFLIYKNWDRIAGWWRSLWGGMGDEAQAGADKVNDASDSLQPPAKKPAAQAPAKPSPPPAPRPVDDGLLQGAASLLKGYEGYQEQAKWDVNAYRAGYGSDTVTDPSTGRVSKVTATTRVTREQADADLSRRLKDEFIPMVQRTIGDGWNKLSTNTKEAIVSVSYNYGRVPVAVAQAAKSGDAAAVAKAIDSLKNQNNGVNFGRREKEAAIAVLTDDAKKSAVASGTPYTAKQLAAATTAPNVSNSQVSHNTTTEVHIGAVNVNAPQAKNATQIASAIKPAIERVAQQANYGPV